MNAMGLPGIAFQAVAVPVDQTAAKYPGQTIPAVRLAITDRFAYRPVSTALVLIDTIRDQHPGSSPGAVDRRAHRIRSGAPGDQRRSTRAAAGGVGPGGRPVPLKPGRIPAVQLNIASRAACAAGIRRGGGKFPFDQGHEVRCHVRPIWASRSPGPKLHNSGRCGITMGLGSAPKV